MGTPRASKKTLRYHKILKRELKNLKLFEFDLHRKFYKLKRGYFKPKKGPKFKLLINEF